MGVWKSEITVSCSENRTKQTTNNINYVRHGPCTSLEPVGVSNPPETEN
jgi:hypothetical protein